MPAEDVKQAPLLAPDSRIDSATFIGEMFSMRLADFPELQRLSPQERLQIAEELWDSAADDQMPVPVTHKTLIRSRRLAYEEGSLPVLTMDELEKSLRRNQ